MQKFLIYLRYYEIGKLAPLHSGSEVESAEANNGVIALRRTLKDKLISDLRINAICKDSNGIPVAEGFARRAEGEKLQVRAWSL